MLQFLNKLFSRFKLREDVELKYFRKYSRLVHPTVYNELLKEYTNGDIIFEPIRHKISQEDLDKLYIKIDKANFLSDLEKFETIVAFMYLIDGSFLESKIIMSRFEKIFGKEFVEAIDKKRDELKNKIAVRKLISFIKRKSKQL